MYVKKSFSTVSMISADSGATGTPPGGGGSLSDVLSDETITH